MTEPVSSPASPAAVGTKPAPPRRLLRRALIAGALLLLVCVIAASATLLVYHQMAAQYDLSKVSQIPSRSEVFDSDGALRGRIENVNHEVVPLSAVSPLFLKAIVAREDERFYQHHGVDYLAIARAIVRDVSRSRREGGSTITQQLARNSLPLGRERTLHRKLLEAMVAARIEKRYSKDQILEAYVNRIYLGAGVYGVETAAQRYFGKPAQNLDLSESALLAGIVRSPNTNSPLRNPGGAKAERDSVLDRLVVLGQMPPNEIAAAKAQGVSVKPSPTGQPTALAGRDYGMDAVRVQLDELLGSDDLDLGGLRIYTTLDSRLQRAAERAVNGRLEKVEEASGYEHATRAAWIAAHPAASRNEGAMTPDYLQGALIAVDNKTGAIRVLVGGRSYEESSFNRALARPGRPIGSTFKPFVYAAAFERGMLPTTPVEDSPLRPDELQTASNENWSPSNADGKFLGTAPADVGLIQSRNVMAIRVGEWAGRENVRALAQRAGLLDERTPAQPSLHLGAFEASPRAVAGAFTAFPNRGVARSPYLIERITNADGETLYRAPGANGSGGATVMSAESAQLTNDLLERVLSEGTGKSAASLGLRVPAAGKTGTTDDFKDAWFAGYTTSLTCAVWVGFDRPQTITSRGSGATLALPIWVDFMQAAASLNGPGTAKRYPALALHGGGTTKPATNNSAPDSSALANATPAAPPPLEQNGQSTPPPTDQQSTRYVMDARTGRIIGLDGTEAAAREAQLRQQEAARQQTLAQQQREQQLAAQQQQAAGYGSVPPEPTVVPDADNLPVRRAGPVSHVTMTNGVTVPVDQLPTRRASPVVSHVTIVNGVVTRVEELAPRQQPGQPPAAIPVDPTSADGAPAPTPRRRVVHTQIVTMPDGSKRVERTVENPLGH